MKAFLNLRHSNNERSRLFEGGLQAIGYEVVYGVPKSPDKNDILVTWNRIHRLDAEAKKFEAKGNKVLVVENASWGNSFCGESWLHIARGLHNTAGCVDYLGPDRFDDLHVDLSPWRNEGGVIIILQRGIGSSPVAMPQSFQRDVTQIHKGRIRRHPGKLAVRSLEEDLKDCAEVVTWSSGAAIKALQLGIRVKSYYPNWIGAQNNTDEGRLQMFQQLAWAQWRLSEIGSGYAFSTLLTPPSTSRNLKG